MLVQKNKYQDALELLPSISDPKDQIACILLISNQSESLKNLKEIAEKLKRY
jgi:hypothetical protein